MFSRLPIVALVIAAEDIDLGAEPEEGKPGETAAALDDAAHAERKARAAQKEAEKKIQMAEKRLHELESLEEGEEDPEKRKELRKAYREAQALVKQALREAAETRRKANEATLFAEKTAGIPLKPDEEKVGETLPETNDKE